MSTAMMEDVSSKDTERCSCDSKAQPVVETSEATSTERHVEVISLAETLEATSSECNVEPIPAISYLSEEKPKDPALLPPDHPLMQRFQQTLKEYLTNLKTELTQDIAEINRQLQEKEVAYAKDTSKLVELNTAINRQNEQLEQKAKEAEEMMTKRIKMENKLEELKNEHDTRLTDATQKKRLYEKRMIELENMNTLQGYMRNWADEVGAEVKNAQRVVARDKQMQKQKCEEKKKADMCYYYIESQMKELEMELQIMNSEVNDMRHITDTLKTRIVEADTDLQMIEAEQKHLSQAWHDVIIAVGHRDKILLQVQQEMNRDQETITINEMAIEAIKKQIAKETKIHVKLERFKSRILYNCGNLRNQCQIQSEDLQTLQNKLEALPAWITQNERDLGEATREGIALESEIRRLQLKIDRTCSKKFHVEGLILNAAEDQLASHKASQYRLKLLKEARDTRRQMEVNLAACNNQLAQALLNIERRKHEIFVKTTGNEQWNSKLTDAEKQYKVVNAEIASLDTQIEIILKKMEKVNARIEELRNSGIELGAGPLVKKINLLEKELNAGEQQIREYQQFWLMLQNHFVSLSDKRNKQLMQLQTSQTQLSIIKQKSLRIDVELEEQEAFTKELERDIQAFSAKLSILNAKVAKAMKHHSSKEKECEMEHATLMNRLKENEMKVLSMEKDLNKLEDEIEEYKDQVLERNREALSLETKYKLIEETLCWRKEEQKADSETSLLKAEIHRLNLRHQQLLRTQTKISNEFERCIKIRENIQRKASIKQFAEMKAGPGKAKARQPVNHLPYSLKKTNAEIKAKQENVAKAEEEYNRLQAEMNRLGEEIEQEKAKVAEIEEKLHKGVLKKLLNLERIVRKQNRAKEYRRQGAVTNVTSRKLFSEETWIRLMEKEQKTNNALYEIVGTLHKELPDLKVVFDKIRVIIRDEFLQSPEPL